VSLIARWTIYENTDSPSDVPLVGHGIGPEIDGWTRIEAVPVEQLQGAVDENAKLRERMADAYGCLVRIAPDERGMRDRALDLLRAGRQ
jgi:hypothetical protein